MWVINWLSDKVTLKLGYAKLLKLWCIFKMFFLMCQKGASDYIKWYIYGTWWYNIQSIISIP